jgi:L-alanine-DL-glutamate epimerase-like enolase superfamily enzyme
MKITSVKPVRLRVPFKNAYPEDSLGHGQYHDTVIVMIETNEGYFGVGEATPWSPLDTALTAGYLEEVIGRFYAHALVGMDPHNLVAVHERMDRSIYGHVGLAAAKGAVDCALHDLLGRSLDLPVVELIGGRVRDRLPAMVGIGIGQPEKMAADARNVVDRLQVRFLKVKIGGGRINGRWPVANQVDVDIERLKQVRAAIDPSIVLIADANQAYSPSEAIRVIKAADIWPCMFEQPVDGGDLEGLARVALSVDVPIIADESAYTPARLLRLLKQVPVAAVNVKPSRAGGFYGSLQMIRIVEAAGLKCTIDCVLETRVGGAMIAHLAANVREDAYLATTATLVSDLWLDDEPYFTGATSFSDGDFRLLNSPGLGVQLASQFLDHCRATGSTYDAVS